MKNRLEELRKQRGIKQEDLANALEVSRQTIGSLENGRYNPSIQLAFKIARYFNMSMNLIRTGNESSSRPAGGKATRKIRLTGTTANMAKSGGMNGRSSKTAIWKPTTARNE